MMKKAVLFVASIALACGGRKDEAASAGQEQPEATPAGGPAAAPAAAQGGGTISGTVKFTGTAPPNPVIDMSEEPQCKDKYSGAINDPQVVVNDGKVANVFVYVKGGLPAGQKFNPPAEPAVVDQSGCLYQPRVVGAMVGQKLQIKNSDPVLHNIKAVPKQNRGFNISQPRPMTTDRAGFTTQEVMVPLECNVHGWMHASVGVLQHPFFAVSDKDGNFKISGLPPGTYDIEAWHEKLGTQTMKVTLGADETKTADVTFAPKA